MIDKIRYRLVYNRKHQLNRQGTALVQIEALLNRRKLYISTNLYLRPGQWDQNTSQVINHPQSYDLNAMLYDKILELQAAEISYWRQGVSPSLLDIKAAAKQNITADVTFMQFARRSVEQSSRRTGTKQNMMATLNRMKEFRGDVEIRDVDYRYLTDFEAYLRGLGLMVNSVGKHLRNVRTLINEAINHGYLSLSDYPFRQFRIKKETPEHRVMTAGELMKLEKVVLKSKRKQRILDSFLFCCYTGLRFSDFKQLTAASFIKIRGHSWIDMKSIKTGIHQRIPVYLLFDGKGLDLIERYTDISHLTRIGYNADVNRTLKDICQVIGIEKRITWHTARHTFATQLLAQSVPITTIQKLLGHTSVKTTQIYSEVLDNTLIIDLKKTAKRSKSRTEVEHRESTLILPAK